MIKELNKICRVIEKADLTKYNTYRLASVCDALTKDYKGVSFEAKRQEKRLIFQQK